MNKRALSLGLALAFLSITPACGDAKSRKDEASDKKDDKEEKDEKSSKKGDGSAKASVSGSASAPAEKPTAPSAAVAGAAAHLTGDCDVAGRLDVSQLLATPGFKKEVVPALDEILAMPSPKDDKFKKMQIFIKEQGLDYKTALSDIVFCVQNVAGDAKFAIAIGGSFKPETLVDAIDKQRTEKKVPIIDVDGRKAFSDDKFAFGQLGDGTVVMSDKLELFKAMNATSDAATSVYKLDTSKMLVAGTSDDALTKAFAAKPPKKGGDIFALMKTVRMTADLAKNQSTIVIGCRTPEDASKLNAYLTVAMSELEKNPSKAPFPNAEKLLKATKVSASGSDITVVITQSQEDTDQAFKYAADELRKVKATL
jgi:hypothetical protein